MSILDNAVKHFSGQRQLKQVDVPEWDGAVFFYEPQNLEELCIVQRYFDPKNGGFSPEALAATFVSRARDEKGELLFSRRLFDEHMKQVVRDYDPNVVARVATKMIGAAQPLSLEDAEKN